MSAGAGATLPARRHVYIWADGVYLQARMEPEAECILVIIGAAPEGKKEFLGFHVGARESTQSWRELLVDLKTRGLTIPPELVVGDGALRFWKAMDEIYPATRHQRCWFQKSPMFWANSRSPWRRRSKQIYRRSITRKPKLKRAHR